MSPSFADRAFVCELPTEAVRNIRISIEESSDLAEWSVVGFRSGDAAWSWNVERAFELVPSPVPGYQRVSVEVPPLVELRDGIFYRLRAEFE